MATVVIMPRQGQSVESCIFTEWFKQVGDEVKKGEPLFAYETDKASFEEEAAEDGILLGVFCEEGDEIPVLQNIAVIGQPGENIDEFMAGGSSGTQPEAPLEEEAISASPNVESSEVSEEVVCSG